MKTFLITIALISFSSFGQSGIYGKRTVIEFQGMGTMPIVYNALTGIQQLYKQQGTNLVDSRHVFEFGFRTGISHAFTNQFGLGLEFGFERQVMSAPSSVRLTYQNGSFSGERIFNIRHEKLRLNTFTFMPKIEISSRTNLLPIGLSHQIGVGYTRASVGERDYLLLLENPNNDTITSPIETGVINYEDTYTGFTFMYQISMRTPVTDQLMISYGIRYNANFVRQTRPINGPNPVGQLELINDVRRRRNFSFIQLNVGIAYAL